MNNDLPKYPLVSVIILSYNRCDELRHTLSQVYSMNYQPYEVIVVDNNSADGTQQMTAKEYPQVHFIALPKNIGIAGWNEGSIIAQGEFILFLDDDSYPEKDALKNGVLQIMIDNKCGLIAYDVYNTTFNRSQFTDKDKALCRTFIGCGALVRRNLFVELGGFEKKLFLYNHEIEFSMRLIDYGYFIKYIDDKIIHIYSRSHRPLNRKNLFDKRKAYYEVRNSIIILLLHFPLRRVAGRIMRIIIGRLLFGIKQGYLFLFLKGIIAGILQFIALCSRRLILSDETQKKYGYGNYAAGFFVGDNFYGTAYGFHKRGNF